MEVFAMFLTPQLRNGKLKAPAGATFFVRFCSGGDGDIHTTQRIDLVVIDFRENDLLRTPML
jgi:hypothetical protein